MALAVSKSMHGLRTGDKIELHPDNSCRVRAFTIDSLDAERDTEDRWVKDAEGNTYRESHGYTITLLERKAA